MARFGDYPLSGNVSNGNTLIGKNKTSGEIEQYPLEIVAEYVRNFGLKNVFGIFSDGASEAAWIPVPIVTAALPQYQRIRNDLSGSRQDISNFPSAVYGNLFINRLAAPNETEFDFTLLEKGKRVAFEVEMEVKMAKQDESTWDTNDSYGVEMTAVFPDGSSERSLVFVPETNYDPVNDLSYPSQVKFSFSTYIKDVPTQSLIGGYLGIRLFKNDIQVVGVSPQLYYRNFRVTAVI